jgi:hypothetical protein
VKPDTDDLLGPMRSAWKAGIERDERDEHAASARRLARAVTPEDERSRLSDLLPLAACVAACVLGVIAFRHDRAAPIRADETDETHETTAPAPPPALSVEPAAGAPVEPAPAPAPAPAPPPKVKSSPPTLPPLPPPAPSSTGDTKMKRFELKIFHRRERPRARAL